MSAKLKRLRRLSRVQQTVRDLAQAQAEHARRQVQTGRDELEEARGNHRKHVADQLQTISSSSELMVLFEERALNQSWFQQREQDIDVLHTKAEQHRLEARRRSFELRRTEQLQDQAKQEFRRLEAKADQAANDDLAASRQQEAA